MLNSNILPRVLALTCLLSATVLVARHGEFLGGLESHLIVKESVMTLLAQRQDGRTCREVVENDRKIVKCCRQWLFFDGGIDCVYN